ncbi:ABC transporter permease [Cellulomonas composti]|uniref:Exporter of polyketide antibiotics n=1 Tax=Cellulomonas composti TaxID=266130 RepID=A0A511J7T6_9CELL|nr:ABC transporter permease [Cellulomonas composti]GEL94048.1 exporter of polyketide antibiotics [Cellulomonas composti]
MSAITTARPPRASAVTGTRPLLRVSLKHDGRTFVPWAVIATTLSVSSIILYPIVFPDEASRAALAATISANPAVGLVFGPANDLMTADGFNAWRSLALGGLMTALGAIFAMTRATRAQEDSGQAELLASGVMGRDSRLLTGVAMSAIGSLLVGVAAGLLTIVVGGDPESSLLLAATFTATGWVFGSLAGITAQIGADARTSNSMAVGALGTLFVLSGFCYSVEAPTWTNWVNPIGWMHETRPAAGNNWAPLLLAVALSVVLVAVAFLLQGRRDFGQGTIAPRPGPDRGVTRTTWRLALRINRGPFLTWTVAFVALGFVFGYFATSISDLLASDQGIQQVIASGATTPEEITSTFVRLILSMVGILAAISGIQVMLKVRSEELEDRVEPLMAGSVARHRYYGSNALVAFAYPTVFVLIAGTLIAWLASGSDLGVTFGDVLLQAVVTVPAVWTVVAVSVAVIGARPMLSIASWSGVLVSFVLTVLGPTFGLDDWVLGISPFWHVPYVAAADPDWTGLGWITLFTLGFLWIGFAGFRRRDLAR